MENLRLISAVELMNQGNIIKLSSLLEEITKDIGCSYMIYRLIEQALSHDSRQSDGHANRVHDLSDAIARARVADQVIQAISKEPSLSTALGKELNQHFMPNLTAAVMRFAARGGINGELVTKSSNASEFVNNLQLTRSVVF